MARKRLLTRKPRLEGRRRFRLAWIGGGIAVLSALLYFGLLGPYWRLAGQLSDRPVLQPSRLYGQPPLLYGGVAFSRDRLRQHLESQGYRGVEADALKVGEFRLSGRGELEVRLRRFPTPQGSFGPAALSVFFTGPFVERLELEGSSVPSVWLEAPLISSYYGPTFKERRPLSLEAAPAELIRAVLAAEDAAFFQHSGVSLRGTVRATWTNLRRGGLRQGGSTLTQQLVKNLFLSPERSVVRKLREWLLAWIVEIRHSKEEILQAYLNEIYWGRSGQVNLMGVGAAAWAYFGKHPGELDLGEAACLAGMIASPNRYSPVEHPEEARARRDWVLERLHELEWLTAEELEAVQQTPVRPRPQEVDRHQARYAADAVAAEVEARYGLSKLADGGYTLFSSLVLEDQVEAEESVSWGLKALEGGWEKSRRGAGPLQAALISADPRDGRILAYVGGRDYGSSQFDRVRFARRQPGSAFKTFVYLAAFADRVSSPATLLDDSPLTLQTSGSSWSPRNDDGEFRGPVTARQALEESLNVPTVRLAEAVGVGRVAKWAAALGVTSRLDPVPSLALGSSEVTPWELLNAYATLAAGGQRVELHAVVSVFDRHGQLLEGEPVAPPTPVLAPEVAYLTTSVLQGVLDRGTGSRVRQDGLHDALAGKTGTSSRRRDSWFVGFSPQRATLVWVGYDGGAETSLSGSRAALPIWARFALARRPTSGYRSFQPPPGVTTVTIDPVSGGRATGGCPSALTEVFLYDQVPSFDCPLHGRWDDWRWRRDRRGRKWKRLFESRRGNRFPWV